jgi:translin
MEQLTVRNLARERALSISREVIRLSANAIRAVHRAEFDEARRLIKQASLRLKESEHMRLENPEIYHAGFLADARKEFSEANVTLAVISGAEIPGPEDIGVDPPGFLNGMAEVIGELRRYILDALRRESFDRCNEYMDIMDEIYEILVTMDFPEPVTGGLRHSTDQMRGVLERTRGDLTMALRQQKLETRLANWEDRLSGGSH